MVAAFAGTSRPPVALSTVECDLLQVLDVGMIDIDIVGTLGACTTGVLPFRLCRQAVDIVLRQASSLALGLRNFPAELTRPLPADAFHGMLQLHRAAQGAVVEHDAMGPRPKMIGCAVGDRAALVLPRLVVVILRHHQFVELALGNFVDAHVERLRYLDLVLDLIIASMRFALRATHGEITRGYKLHLKLDAGHGPALGFQRLHSLRVVRTRRAAREEHREHCGGCCSCFHGLPLVLGVDRFDPTDH